jgi:glucosyl-dolichyl phosphate glucuronosyltransferase
VPLDTQRPQITVVLPTCNRLPGLRDALASLSTQRTDGRFAYDVLVVGNDCRAETSVAVEEWARRSPVPVRYVHEDRRGVSFARNRGILTATADWIAFFDDDQVADAGWLAELFASADVDATPCVGGRIVLRLPDGAPPLTALCRNLLGEQPFDGPPFRCTGRRIPSSGNLMVARRLFTRLGAFDVAMAAGGEDSELVRRLRRADVPITVAPAAVVYHVVPSSRTQLTYLRSISERTGSQFAYIDWKEHGTAGLLLRCFARTVQGLAVTLPALVAGVAQRNAGRVLDNRALLWRCRGYLRHTAVLLVGHVRRSPAGAMRPEPSG